MIFKKPYKFLLKHFKLIHLIITVLIIYLTTRSHKVLNFFNEYDRLSSYISTENLTEQLFNIQMFIIPVIITIGMFIIVYLLSRKDKPRNFYFFNALIFLATIVINIYTYNVCNTLETKVVDIRVIKAIENFYLMLYVIGIVDTVVCASRALGFNIKKFNFNGDDELKITEEDNEEFELKLEFDTNKTRRNIKKNLRYLWYSYRENRLYINIFIIVLILLISGYIYIQKKVLNVVYTEKKYIQVENFSLSVIDSFITNYDNDGNKLTNNNIIIVKIDIKKLDELKEKLVLSKFSLISDDLTFKYTDKYNNKLDDIGNIYKNQIISSNKYSEYILIFEVPIGFENNLLLTYNYGKNKIKKIKINPKEFNKNNFDVEANIGEELSINDDIIKNTTLKISSYEINDIFKIDYSYKAYNNELYDSYEYIVPDYIDNCDKVIIRISGNLKNDKLTLGKFIEKYGKLEYKNDGQFIVINTKLRNIKPNKTISDDYYFSVCNDFINSEEFNLLFKIRGNTYRFNLNGAR